MVKRLVAEILAVLVLLLFSGCGTGDDPAVTIDSLVNTETEKETNDINYTCELSNDLDYHEEEVNFLYVNKAGRSDELVSKKLSGGTVSDAVYERNIMIGTRLNVRLVFDACESDGEVQEAVRRAVSAGDTTLDVISIGTYGAMTPSVEGLFLDLNSLEHINLAKYYWSQDFNNMMTFTSENKQFVATSPAALSLFRLTYLTIYNRGLLNDRGIDDLFETVMDGNWTLEFQNKLISDTWVDLDGNGAPSDNDFYGLITGNVVSADAYAVASNIHLVDKDENGFLVYQDDELDNLVDMAEKVSALYNNQGSFISKIDDIGYYSIIEKFVQNQGLMATTQFLSLENYVDSLSELSYGIAPMPKLHKAQERYYTYVQDQVSCFGVSSAISDTEEQSMLSAVMEALAYYSNEIVRPAYYDSALSLRYMQDPQSRDVLDMMFETIAFDYCYATGVGGIRDEMRGALSSTNPAIVSKVKRWKRNAERNLETINDSLEKLDN